MQTLLLLVWGTPCEGTVVGIGETRGRHGCLEGSQNEVFYSGAIVFQPLRAARKCVLVFYEIVLLSVWLASGATSHFQDVLFGPRTQENTRFGRSSRDTVLKNFFVILINFTDIKVYIF